MLALDRSWTRPSPTSSEVRTDVVWALVIALVSVASVEVWRNASPISLGWKGVEGYLWFGAAGLALAGRRRFPLTTLLVESAIFITVGERVEGLSGVLTIQMILFASVYAAWAWSRRTRSLFVVSGIVLAAMFGWLVWSIFDQAPDPPRPSPGLLTNFQAVLIYSVAINVVYFLGAMAWGHVAWRSARQRAEILVQAERERVAQEMDRERAVQAERVRIARDLHDVVAHHVSGIGVQAAGAGRVMDSRPESARKALSTIEQSARQAVLQMHQLVGLLRADGDPAADRVPRPGIGELASLASTGDRPEVAVKVVGEPFTVPATIGLSLFRIAQESVANTRQHARASRADVVLRYIDEGGDEPRSVEVEIVDDGGPVRVRPTSGGFGLTGIRERTAMHDGSSEIGPRPDGGFRVRVRIPVMEP